jgi:membrane protease YdiL (CAAX protease family)
MTIIASAETIDPWAQVIFAAGLVLIAVIGLAVLGVFRRRSIAGPERVGSQESLQPLLIVAFAGLTTWLFAAAFIAPAVAGPHPTTSTTNPDISPTQPRQVAAEIFPSIAAVALMLCLSQQFTRPPPLLGFSPGQFPAGFARGALGFIVVLPLVLLSLMAMELLLDALHQTQPHVHEMLKMLGQSNSLGARILILLSALIVAPIAEEVFFRGYLQTILVTAFARIHPEKPMSASPRWIPVILTAILFALAHDWWSWPSIFILALCLGYAYERTGNLWTSITIHALFNAASVILYQTATS